jgi:hypothetical protein
VDPRLEGDQGQNLGRLDAERTPRSAPSLDPGDELAEELHRSLGSSRATRHSRSGTARHMTLVAGAITELGKMHDTCPPD